MVGINPPLTQQDQSSEQIGLSIMVGPPAKLNIGWHLIVYSVNTIATVCELNR